MAKEIEELHVVAGGEIDGHPIRVTDELPKFIGAPMNWILVAMKGIVMFSGFLMACTFGAVVVIRYGFGGDLFAYEEWLLAISIVGFLRVRFWPPSASFISTRTFWGWLFKIPG